MGSSAAGLEMGLCAHCADLGHTCCQGTVIFLTCGDVERLRAAGERDFYVYAPPVPEGVGVGCPDDPLWARTFRFKRRVVKHQSGEDCYFLTGEGCRLSSDVRPLICRLYPYEYNPETLKGVTAHRCPEPQAGNAPLLLAMLGMNRDMAEEWRKMLYREIVEEFPDGT